MTGHRVEPIAVTGIGVRNSIAATVAGFASALRAGACGVTAAGERLPPSARVRVGAWLAGGEPATSERRLRCAWPGRVAAEVALDAVRAAGLGPGDLDRAALLVAGNNLALDYQARTLADFAERPASLRPSHALTHLDTDVIGAVSEATGVRGEGVMIGGASASGTLAVIAAARLIAAGEADHCLVVAPPAELSAAEFRAFHDAGAMAHERFLDQPERVCRPFDQLRQGFVYGQGGAAVVLERPDTARERGVRPAALIIGHGQRLDGRRGTEPDPTGLAAAMRAALDRADLTAGDVDYVNAHATGSVAGDSSEATALVGVFGAADRPLVNSTKPLIGHCLSAAGLQELIATILQAAGGFCHANPNLDQPLRPAPALVGKVAEPAGIRFALSNSLAFSGINASILLQLPNGTTGGAHS